MTRRHVPALPRTVQGTTMSSVRKGSVLPGSDPGGCVPWEHVEVLRSELRLTQAVIDRAREYASDTGDDTLWALLFVKRPAL